MFGRAVPNRIIRYEVATLSKDRWVIECLRNDEADAITTAKALLKTDRYEAVRVTRERAMLDGFTTETPVFEERHVASNKQSLKLSGSDEQDGWCANVEELYQARSRRLIGQLIRSFLDHHGITVMELLHDFRWMKKIDAAGNLKPAALHRIVRSRAESTSQPMNECRRELDRILEEASGRARDAIASRVMPRFTGGELSSLFATVRQVSPNEGMQGFLARHAICRWLEQRQGLPDRMALIMSLPPANDTAPGQALIDAFAADCLGGTQVVQDMLGRQPNIGSALLTLAELASGQLQSMPRDAAKWLPELAQLIASRPCPEIRDAMVLRIRKALASEQAFTRGDSGAEAKILVALGEKLKDAEGGLLGGVHMVQAIAKRYARLDVPGGMEEIKLPNADIAARLQHLLGIEKSAFSELKKRAVATLVLDTLRRADPQELAAARGILPELANSGLLPPAKQAIAALLDA